MNLGHLLCCHLLETHIFYIQICCFCEDAETVRPAEVRANENAAARPRA